MRFASALLLIALLASCGGSQAPVGALDLQALRGQWVVINYWAQWCKPCIKEIPELNELDQEFEGVTVLGVNYDGETGEELAAQIEKLGVAFTTLAQDPSAALGVPRPVVLPTTLILDPEGQLDATLVGPQTLETLAAATGQSVRAGHE